MSRKLTQLEFDYKRKEVHNEKYECLDDYINMNTPLRFICKVHGIFKQKPSSHINQKQGCPSCKFNSIKTIQWLHLLADSNDGKCLAVEYKGANFIYDWLCKKGHEWKAVASNVAQGDWCKICGYKKTQEKRKLQNGLSRLQTIAAANNGKCLSEYYKNSSTKYKWECKKGHIWKAIYPSIEKGSWCPICRESKGERVIANILDKLGIQYIRQYSFSNCRYKYKLRFDFFLPTYNCLIEFDGKQHFKKPINKWKKFNLKYVQDKDKIKNEYCINNGVKLLRIPYNMFDKIRDILYDLYKTDFKDPINYSLISFNS